MRNFAILTYFVSVLVFLRALLQLGWQCVAVDDEPNLKHPKGGTYTGTM